MSIRRKSCDQCFRARRKCDQTYPICERCQRTSKECDYPYPPQLVTNKPANGAEAIVILPATEGISSGSVSYPRGCVGRTWDRHDTLFQLTRNGILQWNPMRQPSVPKGLGNLGEFPPLPGGASSTWVFDQIRGYPLSFARKAETIFIHKSLHRNSLPRSLRVAFGICAACVSINERNSALLFQAVDAEMSELLTPVSTTTLLEALVRLQATVLYQIVRIFYGGFEQRVLAERQEYLIRNAGLALLRRAGAELRSAQQTWETWILAESIRRTVIILFKLYTTYSSFIYGFCSEIEAVRLLPISTKQGAWDSQEVYQLYPKQDDTLPHGDFALLWAAAPRREVDPIQKLLLVGCKGIDHFEAFFSSVHVMD